MPTRFHSILQPSLPPPSQQPFSFVRAPPKGAHSSVRALSPLPLLRVMALDILSRYLIVIIILFKVVGTSLSDSDPEMLIKFRDSLDHNGALSSWNAAAPLCKNSNSSWVGVLCEGDIVWGLKLENMGLKGTIDVDSLKQVSTLRAISFMNNNFEGPLPELKKLSYLKTIYLSKNKFKGGIPPDAFDGMQSLKKLYLDNNEFSGDFPLSLAKLPRLIELGIEENMFEGQIPDFRESKLRYINVSNNNLKGQIPPSLNAFNESSFSGNEDLCGAPLPECKPNTGKLSVLTIVIVAVVVVAALAAIATVIVILRRRKQTTQQEQASGNPQAVKKVASADLDKLEQGSPSSSPDHSSHSKSDQSVKLSFLRDDRMRFDMTDLLKASAEILGSGVFGSTCLFRVSL